MNVIQENAALRASLAEAVRYIEVAIAYRGAMTAAEVEEAIKRNSNITRVNIGANSVSTLATFRFDTARRLLESA